MAPPGAASDDHITNIQSHKEVMMRPVAITLLFVLLLLCSAQAYGESYFIELSGSGGLMLDGADYSGTIDSGMDGTWDLYVDDSLWPDESDSTARFEYIWNTFFASNYTDLGGAEHWTGYFNAGTLPSSPTLILDTTAPGGILGMNADFTVKVRDYYADGELSQYEKHHASQMSFTLSVEMPLGTGAFIDYCGDGSSSNGSFNFINPPDPDTLDSPFFAQINTWFCGAPVEEETWGVIKALYR